MDHSVESYLRRRTVEELEEALEGFIKERGDKYYDMCMDIILQILKERKGRPDGAEEQN